MFLLEWYKEWLTIRAQFKQNKFELSRDEKVCQSCETLKSQLEIANYEKGEILKRLLKEPEPIPERTEAPPMKAVPKIVPWQVRRQMLEREDREKARILKNAPTAKPTVIESEEDKKETELFEQELKNAEQAREGKAAQS